MKGAWLLVSALGFLVIWSCTNDLDQVMASMDEQDRPVLVTHDLKLMYSDSGKIRFVMEAPLREVYQGKEPRSEMPKGLTTRFLDESGKEASTLRADSAVMYEKDNLVVAMGNVRVTNSFGEELSTSILYWRDNPDGEGLIYTDQLVEIKTKDKLLTGLGMTADRDFSPYRFLVPTGTIYLNED